MKLWLEVNKITRKKNWNKEKCYICNHRFTCFSGNEIIVEPEQVNVDNKHFVAVFLVPSCLRVGIFKQLPDTWFTSNFKYGKVLETNYDVLHATITIKPPTIQLEGRTH